MIVKNLEEVQEIKPDTANFRGAVIECDVCDVALFAGRDLSGCIVENEQPNGVVSGKSVVTCDFRNTKFVGGRMRNLFFDRCLLEGADFRGADLRRSSFSSTSLKAASFQGARLEEADLVETDCQKADFRGADLHNANLCGADLRGADMRGAKLRRANLSGADLRGALLDGADLYETRLDRAIGNGKNIRTLMIGDLVVVVSPYGVYFDKGENYPLFMKFLENTPEDIWEKVLEKNEIREWAKKHWPSVKRIILNDSWDFDQVATR